jgi:hypothetical protein
MYAIEANEEGFYIRKERIFFLKSSLLFIPWPEVTEVERSENRKGTFYVLRIGTSEKVSMLLPQLPFLEVTSILEKKIKVRVWNKVF